MTTQELIRSIREISTALDEQSRWVKKRRNGANDCDISDLLHYSELETANADLAALLRFGQPILNGTLSHYKEWIEDNINIGDLHLCSDEMIYALYQFNPWPQSRMTVSARNPEILFAISYLHKPDQDWPRPPIISFSDGTLLLDRRIVLPKNIPADAINADNVAEFCLKMNINGKQLSYSLLIHLIQNQSVKILEHIIRNNRRLSSVFNPANLLLTVLHYINPCEVLPVIKAIEETYLGTIRTAEDARGHNALLFARLQNHKFRTDRQLPLVEEYLLSKGCDPAKVSKDGFSWNAMKRLTDIIERFEQQVMTQKTSCH